MCSPTRKFSESALLGFYGGSITYSLAIKSMAIGDWFKVGCSPAEVMGAGTESSTPLITWLAPLATRVGSKSHLISITKDTFITRPDRGNYRGFGNCESMELWTKTKYIWQMYFGHLNDYMFIFLINHNVTASEECLMDFASHFVRSFCCESRSPPLLFLREDGWPTRLQSEKDCHLPPSCRIYDTFSVVKKHLPVPICFPPSLRLSSATLKFCC